MDLVEKFWRKWIKADTWDREKLLTPIVKMVEEHTQLPKKMRERSLRLCLNGYFEDLYWVAYDEGKKDSKRSNTSL